MHLLGVSILECERFEDAGRILEGARLRVRCSPHSIALTKVAPRFQKLTPPPDFNSGLAAAHWQLRISSSVRWAHRDFRQADCNKLSDRGRRLCLPNTAHARQ